MSLKGGANRNLIGSLLTDFWGRIKDLILILFTVIMTIIIIVRIGKFAVKS